MQLHLVGIGLALSSALVYGSADFFGGLASRRSPLAHVLWIGSSVSLPLMVLLSVLWGESLPSLPVIAWSCLAGLFGAVGLAILYRGLSAQNAAIVSPLSEVVSASLPVLYAALFQAPPSLAQAAGFAAALPAIWLLTQSPSSQGQTPRTAVLFGLSAGVGFGMFFIFLSRAAGSGVFAPLAFARLTMLCLILAVIVIGKMRLPSLAANPPAVFAGLQDTAANALYLLACSFTRLDVAAVLTSLYPASTVLLSRWVHKTPITPRQWIGVVLCLLAIALITS
jgi:drug/metabolite transporter (DMT)-like permease